MRPLEPRRLRSFALVLDQNKGILYRLVAMKITKSLLNHFFTEKLPFDRLEELLTDIGLEVEGIEKVSLPFSPVVVAQVKKREKHPKADRLNLVTLFDGAKEVTVVCGDQSVAEGDLVPLVQEGATYKDDLGKEHIFKPKEIRGVFSSGMLLSTEEIGLEEGANGVLRIEERIQPGENLSKLLEDEIYDIALTPNLGHCQSALGIARQLSASLNIPYHLPSFVLPKEELSNPISLAIESEKCPLYMARAIENITLLPSPLSLRFTLQRCGLRSINYIVDITNLMMLLYGQPMHAFDLDQIAGNTITVKQGDLKEFSTLDHQKHTAKDLLIIADEKKATAIAGVMGGLKSSVSERTTKILLEAAYFEPSTILKSQKKLSLKTESSMRFEKGVDPDITLHALNHASQIITSLCKGKASSLAKHEKKMNKKKIPLNPAKTASFLGISLTGSEMESMFKKLECETSRGANDLLHIIPPLYRHDLQEPIDLIEEVAKLYGFNNIPRENPTFRINRFQTSPLRKLQTKAKDICCRLGLYEIITCDLVSEKLAKHSKDPMQEESISTVYSKSKEHSILRSSLFGSHMEIVKENIAHGNKELSFFEISYLHTKQQEKIKEHLAAGIMVTGNTSAHHFSSKNKKWDFYLLKGVIEQFFQPFGIAIALENSTHPFFHPFKQQLITFEGKTLGIFGEVHPNYLTTFDIKQNLYFAQIDLFSLLELEKSSTTMTPLPQFPGTQRDWTIPISRDITAQSILDKIKECNSSLLEKIEVLDRYQDPSNADIIHMTLRFFYRDTYKTLSHEEAEKEHNRIVDSVSSSL